MHYNFETKAALDPSLMFLQVEGTLLTSALTLKQRARCCLELWGSGIQHRDKISLSVFSRKGLTAWMESVRDSGRATLK